MRDRRVAYLDGKRDKQAGIEEPRPTQEPGTSKYKQYVEGYLTTPWPRTRR